MLGCVLGIIATQVKPPLAALLAALTKSSRCSNPGSGMLAFKSNQPLDTHKLGDVMI